MSDHSQPNFLQKLVQRMAATGPVSALLPPVAHRLDRLVLRLSRGRTTAVGLLTGLPLITLTTVGAKSGELRSVPLVGIPDGERLILIASNFGQGHHPAWVHNLRKNSYAAVKQAAKRGEGTARSYRAEEVSGAEYDRCWARALSYYAGYAAYKERTGGRRIPIFLLTPADGG